MNTPGSVPETTVKWVRKRDGDVVPFQTLKIANAIAKAFQATGADDRFLAEETAGMVAMFVEKRFSGEVPGIEDIQDLVERVLIETGHAETAKAYILYREKRARIRKRLQVRESHPAAGGHSGPRVQPGSTDACLPWDKQRIARSLAVEADLAPQLARKIASAVEEKVLSSGLERITTNLIRELVDSELVERDLEGPLRRHAILGMPKYDFQTLVDQRRRLCPTAIQHRIAAHSLRQFALNEVFSQDVAEAHLAGAIHLHHLHAPTQWADLVLDVGALAEAARDLRDLTDSIGRWLADLSPWAGACLSVAWLDAAYADVAGRTGGDLGREGRTLGRLLARTAEGRPLTVLANLHAGAAPELHRTLSAWLEGLSEAVAGERVRIDCHVTPHLFAGDDSPGLLEWGLDLASAGTPVAWVFDRTDVPVAPAASGLIGSADESCAREVCAAGTPQYVGLNLPTALGESWRTVDPVHAMNGIDLTLELVWKAFIQKREFLLGGLRAADEPIAPTARQVTFGLSLVGLDEAAANVMGAHVAEDAGAEAFAAQVIEHIRHVSARQAGKLGLDVRLATPLPADAGQQATIAAPRAAAGDEGVGVPAPGLSATARLLLAGRLHEKAGAGTLVLERTDANEAMRLCRLACYEAGVSRLEFR